MAGLKTIKRRLVSIKNTRQITRAMKLVSAAKLNRAQEAVARSREYSNALNKVISAILAEMGAGDISHPLMTPREEVKNIKLLVIGGSRGLCGAFNTNINKAVEGFLKERKGGNYSIDAVLVGRKPAEYFRRMNYKFSKSYEKLPENPNLWPLQEIAQDLEIDYISGRVDEVYLVYTNFKSVMTQKVKVEKLLPFQLDAADLKVANEAEGSGLTIYEPSSEKVFARLIPRLMRMKIQQAALEEKAGEHASRMTAMDSATKNAGELREKLQLAHNRLRQSNITSQLLDVVGGAEALN
ncbi:MAG: ATP synthase F1 subunit gamma [bacterium]|nr:ATP synthase F1 subunit gamma [bacterium]